MWKADYSVDPRRKLLRRDPALLPAFRMGRLSVGTLPAGSCFLRGTTDPRLLASAFECRGHRVVSFKRTCEILGQAAHQFLEASWQSGFAETIRRIDPSPYFSRPREAKRSESGAAG